MHASTTMAGPSGHHKKHIVAWVLIQIKFEFRSKRTYACMHASLTRISTVYVRVRRSAIINVPFTSYASSIHHAHINYARTRVQHDEGVDRVIYNIYIYIITRVHIYMHACDPSSIGLSTLVTTWTIKSWDAGMADMPTIYFIPFSARNDQTYPTGREIYIHSTKRFISDYHMHMSPTRPKN